MYLFNELHNWDYCTQKAQPQLVLEFRKFANGWIPYLYGKKINKTIRATIPQLY
jgi:hypothetical protein